jgi:hypothetical protein
VRVQEVITEGLSPVVYYYRSLRSAKNILETGNFELSSILGSIEQQYAPKGYPYFLSTTRTRYGGFHSNVVGRSGVLFVLDGRWYSSKYPAKSVDYWQERGNLILGRSSEAEDRIFSKEPTMSIGGVKELHVYVNTKEDEMDTFNARARQVLLLAKKMNIPAYFYTDSKAWLNFDKRNLGDISTLTGQPHVSRRVSTHKGYLRPWLELILRKEKDTLSKKANDIQHDLRYTYDLEKQARFLALDMGNARKPDSGPDRENAVKIIRFMQQNKFNTLRELIDYLKEKWHPEEK